MKTSAILLALLFALSSASGQGQINFANYAPPFLNAPVIDAAGNRLTGSGPYVADLFWSSNTGAPLDSLTAAGFNTGFTTINGQGGYFLGGAQTLPVLGGTPILAQVRVWDTRFGSIYAQARDNGGEFGFSNPLLVTPTLPPPQAATLVGLQPFQLQVIPEPSSLSLAVLGGTIFLLRFRKRIPPRFL